MSLDVQELKQIQASYATASAGMYVSHTLPSKLRAIPEAGYKWTEIALPDLEKYASSSVNGYKEIDSSGAGDIGKLLDAAKDIRKFCDQLGIRVLPVMPFSQFEGYNDASKIKQGLKIVQEHGSK